MTQIHADKKFGIVLFRICVHRPRYLRAKVFSGSCMNVLVREKIFAKLRDADGVQGRALP
jgi:hypothetical protein